MNLEELRDARRTERERDGLQSLPDSFYRDVAAYLADLKAERARAAEAADDPFSDPEVRRLTEEIETAEEVVESIYERRVGKVVDRASFAAADMRHETEGLTTEERELFDDLVARIERNRERVLDALDAGGDATGTDAGTDPEGDPDPATEDAPDPSDLLAEAMGGTPEGTAADPADAGDAAAAGSGATGTPETTDGGVPTGPELEPEPGNAGAAPADGPGGAGDDPAPTAATDDGTGSPRRGDAAGGSTGDGTEQKGTPERAAGTPDRTTVYVTRDVGEIFGVDERTYRLAAEDVVDLPADNARALVERDAAEPLD